MAAPKTEKKTATKTAAKKPVKARAKKTATTDSAEEAHIAHLAPVRREMTGLVVSDKMQKTIVVKVDRRIRHGLYRKYMTNSKRYKAHDEGNTAKVGDLVVIVQSRPLSRDKRWALKTIVRKGSRLAALNVEA